MKKDSVDLSSVAEDLERLTNDINNVFACNLVEHTYYRLRNMGPWRAGEIDLDLLFEIEALQSAIVIAYGRIFADGSRKVSARKIPAALRPIHDEIISLRNQRYAHNDRHPTINVETLVQDLGDHFEITQRMDFTTCLGAPNDWRPLFTWLRTHLHEQLQKQIARLEEKTGTRWIFPTGDPPDWLPDEEG